MALIRSKIKSATGRNQVSRAIGVVVNNLNPMFRGWITISGGNFARNFAAIDSYVHR
jgi:Group II intron, maturase-specific domain